MPKFKDAVIKTVRLIPKERVANYGQIATIVGSPRAAIQVGWILHLAGDDGITPWWRVINKQGFISTKCTEHNKNTQKKLLEKDGVIVSKNLRVDMNVYRWNPDESIIDKLEIENEYLQKLGI